MAYAGSMKIRSIPIFVAALAVFGPLAVSGAAMAAAKKSDKKAETPAAPLSVEKLLDGSKAAAAKGDTQLALRLAQSAIVADPARPGSYVALGELYAHAGESEYARSYYEAALGIDPSYAGALGAMAALDKPHDQTAANDSGRNTGP